VTKCCLQHSNKSFHTPITMTERKSRESLLMAILSVSNGGMPDGLITCFSYKSRKKKRQFWLFMLILI